MYSLSIAPILSQGADQEARSVLPGVPRRTPRRKGPRGPAHPKGCRWRTASPDDVVASPRPVRHASVLSRTGRPAGWAPLRDDWLCWPSPTTRREPY